MTTARLWSRLPARLLLVLGAFLPVLGVALISATVMIDQLNVRPTHTSISRQPDPAIAVNNAPHLYLVVPDPSRTPFAMARYSRCEFSGPAGDVRVYRGDWGYWMLAEHNGTYRIACAPGPIWRTTVEVYYTSDAIGAHYRTWQLVGNLVLVGLLLVAAGLWVLGTGVARRRREHADEPRTGCGRRSVPIAAVGTLLTAPISSVLLIASQVDRVTGQPLSDWQVGGFIAGVSVGVLGCAVALWGLWRAGELRLRPPG